MKILVASCLAYRDAHEPFFRLFDKFWPDCPYERVLIADAKPKADWSKSIADFAVGIADDLLMFQEDFFLNAPVQTELVDEALEEMHRVNAGAVRLYPCPGANRDYGHPHYGIINRGTPYRISCQATIWRSDYLATIAKITGSPSDFEISGTWFANSFPDTVLAFKRECEPWPLSYICSAIGRGKWNPDAINLCKRLDIPIDLSLREIAS